MKKMLLPFIAVLVFLASVSFAVAVDISGNDSMLKITQIKVNDRSVSLDDGISRNLEPGDKVNLKITVKNMHERNSGIRIENIELEAELDAFNYDLDEMIFEAEQSRLSAGSEKTFSFSFTIPYLVDEYEYLLDVNVRGDNQTGRVEFEDYARVYLNVAKSRNKLVFESVELLQETIKCEKEAVLTTKIINTGREDQTVKLSITNSELGIDYQQEFELYSGFDEDAVMERMIHLKCFAIIQSITGFGLKKYL